MSVQALAWVLECSESAGVTRLVLIAIANHMTPAGISWPGYDTIAREANCDKKSVIAGVRNLVAIGELEITQPGHAGRGHSHRYAMPALKGGMATPLTRPVDNPEKVESRAIKGGISSVKGGVTPPEPLEPLGTIRGRARTRGKDSQDEPSLVLHDDRKPCDTCHSSGVVLNNQNLAERCPDCNAT